MARNYYGDKKGRSALHGRLKLGGVVKRTPQERVMRRHDRHCDNFQWLEASMQCQSCGFTGEMGYISKRQFKALAVHKKVSTRNRRKARHGRATRTA